MAESNEHEPVIRLSLVHGGLLQRGFSRLGIVRAGRVDAGRQALVLTGLAWLPLLAATLLGGTLLTWSGSLVTDVEVNVRLLVALPLLLLAEGPVERRGGDVTEYVWRSGMLPAGDRTRWQAILAGAERRLGSAWGDLLLAVLAFAITLGVFLGNPSMLAGHEATTTWFATSVGDRHLRLAGYWYLLVSVPLYQFLVLRWLWRLVIWTQVLAGLALLPLRMLPGHPDGAAGLDVVFRGQFAFAFVFVGAAVTASGTLAAEMIYADMGLPMVGLVAGAFVALAFLIVMAPTLFFVPKLVSARRRALVEHGILSGTLARQFEDEWIGAATAPEKPILGSPDPSSMADQCTAYDYVTKTRTVPLGPNDLIRVAVILAAPFLPLVLLRVPLKEVAKALAGLFF